MNQSQRRAIQHRKQQQQNDREADEMARYNDKLGDVMGYPTLEEEDEFDRQLQRSIEEARAKQREKRNA